MKLWKYVTLLFISSACLVLAITAVVSARANQVLQASIQSQQQALSRGILSQGGQQLSGSILQDMATVALTNAPMKELLAKHGFQVQVTASSETNRPVASEVK